MLVPPNSCGGWACNAFNLWALIGNHTGHMVEVSLSPTIAVRLGHSQRLLKLHSLLSYPSGLEKPARDVKLQNRSSLPFLKGDRGVEGNLTVRRAIHLLNEFFCIEYDIKLMTETRNQTVFSQRLKKKWKVYFMYTLLLLDTYNKHVLKFQIKGSGWWDVGL